jgi:hypothetical protein
MANRAIVVMRCAMATYSAALEAQIAPPGPWHRLCFSGFSPLFKSFVPDATHCTAIQPMHARELVQLAQIVSAQGPLLIRADRQLSASAIQQYWAASKCRFDRWYCALKTFGDDAQRLPPDARHAVWLRLRGVLEEILLAEVLTRVWTAIVVAS